MARTASGPVGAALSAVLLLAVVLGPSLAAERFLAPVAVVVPPVEAAAGGTAPDGAEGATAHAAAGRHAHGPAATDAPATCRRAPEPLDHAQHGSSCPWCALAQWLPVPPTLAPERRASRRVAAPAAARTRARRRTASGVRSRAPPTD